MGIHGFSGNKSLLYHLRPPTAVQRIERGCEVKTPLRAAGPGAASAAAHRRHSPAGGDAVQGRVPLMGNNDVCISVVRPQQPMDYWYRYAHGDEVIFVHEGTGVLESQFGTLRYGPGDYLVIPTGVIWRMLPDAGSAAAHARRRDRRRPHRAAAPLRQQSRAVPRERALLRARHPAAGPRSRRTTRQGEFEVRVKARGRIARYFYQPPSARRRRLGRTSVAVRVQHRRLRADHRPRAPAAAGAPDVRRPGLRAVLVRAAAVRLSPAVDPGARTTTRTSTRTKSSTTSTATSCRGAASRPRRSRCTRTASRTARIPAPTKDRSARPRRDELAVMVDTFRPLR